MFSQFSLLLAFYFFFLLIHILSTQCVVLDILLFFFFSCSPAVMNANMIFSIDRYRESVYNFDTIICLASYYRCMSRFNRNVIFYLSYLFFFLSFMHPLPLFSHRFLFLVCRFYFSLFLDFFSFCSSSFLVGCQPEKYSRTKRFYWQIVIICFLLLFFFIFSYILRFAYLLIQIANRFMIKYENACCATLCTCSAFQMAYTLLTHTHTLAYFSAQNAFIKKSCLSNECGKKCIKNRRKCRQPRIRKPYSTILNLYFFQFLSSSLHFWWELRIIALMVFFFVFNRGRISNMTITKSLWHHHPNSSLNVVELAFGRR